MVGWLGLELAAGWPGVFEKRTLLRSAYAKAAARRAEDGRTPPKGGFEAFPYWSRRFPTCVAVLADGHQGDEEAVFFDRINRIYGICRMNRTEKINS